VAQYVGSAHLSQVGAQELHRALAPAKRARAGRQQLLGHGARDSCTAQEAGVRSQAVSIALGDGRLGLLCLGKP